MNQTPDEEAWLCQNIPKPELDLDKWLYQNTDDSVFEDIYPKLQKIDISSDFSVNSPKKLDCAGLYLNAIPAQDVSSLHLHFDPTQPSCNFENIAANAFINDSFQNTSPPSLVNSSTFVTFMEDSFVKTDPEIAHTEPLLLQTELKFQSRRPSTPNLHFESELLFKKAPFNKTSISDLSKAMAELNLNRTVDQRSLTLVGTSTFTVAEGNNLTENNLTVNLNGTYKKSPKINDSPVRQSAIVNTTVTLEKLSDSNEYIKLSETHVILKNVNDSSITQQEDSTTESNVTKPCSLDLKSASYASIDGNATYTFKEQQKEITINKQNELEDSQEIALQITSTPQVGTKTQKLWECNLVSPICNPDAELSMSLPSEALPLSPKRIKEPTQDLRLQVTHPKLKMVVNSVLAQQRLIAGTFNKSNFNQTSRKESHTFLPTLANTSSLPAAHSQLLNNTQSTSRMSSIKAPRENSGKSKEAQFVKPQIPRPRGLARPVGTGIPKPVSRIPGPRNLKTIANKLPVKTE